MAADRQALAQRLEALRAGYVANLPTRIDAIEGQVAAVMRAFTEGAGDAATAEAVATLRLSVHSLKGSAGTHGLMKVSQAAGRLETAAVGLGEAQIDPADPASLHPLMAELRAAMGRDLGQAPADDVTVVAQGPASDRRLILFDDDPGFAELLVTQFELYGYTLDWVRDEAGMQAALDQPAVAVLIDLVTEASADTGLEMLAGLARDRGDTMPPMIVVTMREDFAARLTAASSGARGYFVKPVDVGEIAAFIERVGGLDQTEDARILIVDDDHDTAHVHASVLEAAGYQVEVLTEPMRVLEVLADVRPDLLLLDMYMPGCTGEDLAAAIRLVPAYVSLPIVFLSAEDDIDRQLAAMARGGDDFLVKPIRPDRLIASVSARASRMRLLREMATLDPMTRLLNHRSIKERITLEIDRGRRVRSPVSVALVDIDRFKSVNDVHGHPVGDAVIKSLARVLRHRMSGIAGVGRYGGEEFAVVMPDTQEEAARAKLDAVREVFGQLIHWSAKGEFSATFSAGVAAVSADEDLDGVIQRADERLYAAKRSGRNRVVAEG